MINANISDLNLNLILHDNSNKFEIMLSIFFYHFFVCAKLFFQLTRYVLSGTKTWIIMFVRLSIFCIILTPGWINLLGSWMFDPLIIKNVEFGRGSKFRNLADIYLPKRNSTDLNSSQERFPVVIFVSGGAWIIGYKFWSALIGKSLSRRGLVVVTPDYRNFPQGNIDDMCIDLRAALLWVIQNIDQYGGDPQKIILAGQSAGAHISFTTLVDLFQEAYQDQLKVVVNKNFIPIPSATKSITLDELRTNVHNPLLFHQQKISNSGKHKLNLSNCSAASDSTWRTVGAPSLSDIDEDPNNDDGECDGGWTSDAESDCSVSVSTMSTVPSTCNGDSRLKMKSIDLLSHIKLFIGVSGPYNLESTRNHLHERGLDSSIINWICKDNVKEFSPSLRLQSFLNINKLSMKSTSASATATAIVEAVGVGSNDLFVSSHSDSSLHPNTIATITTTAIEAEGDLVIPPIPPHSSDLPPSKALGLFQALFPPVALFHGIRDASIPANVTLELHEILQALGVATALTLHQDWTHTDSILEGPLSGDYRLSNEISQHIQQIQELGLGLESSDNSQNSSQTVFPSTRPINISNSRNQLSIESDIRPSTIPTVPTLITSQKSREEQSSSMNAHLPRPPNTEMNDMNKAYEEEKAMVSPFLTQFARFINPF